VELHSGEPGADSSWDLVVEPAVVAASAFHNYQKVGHCIQYLAAVLDVVSNLQGLWRCLVGSHRTALHHIQHLA